MVAAAARTMAVEKAQSIQNEYVCKSEKNLFDWKCLPYRYGRSPEWVRR